MFFWSIKNSWPPQRLILAFTASFSFIHDDVILCFGQLAFLLILFLSISKYFIETSLKLRGIPGSVVMGRKFML